jgi:hypothetical protein
MRLGPCTGRLKWRSLNFPQKGNLTPSSDTRTVFGGVMFFFSVPSWKDKIVTTLLGQDRHHIIGTRSGKETSRFWRVVTQVSRCSRGASPIRAITVSCKRQRLSCRSSTGLVFRQLEGSEASRTWTWRELCHWYGASGTLFQWIDSLIPTLAECQE